MAAVQPARVLIKARWIIPVIPEGRVFENCALVIQGNDIAAILPAEEAEKRYKAEQTISLDNHLLIPGLINAHGHAAMSLLRGFAEDLPLETWLEDHIWPLEGRHVDARFVEDGTELAIAEMIKSGTTCFADMYFYPEAVARVAQRTHMRCQIAFPVMELETHWARSSDECIEKGLALRDEYRGDELIRIAFGPHAPYSLGDEALKKIAILAQELEAPIHIHLHETASEIEQSQREHDMRPSQRLAQLGLMSVLTQCVHMTQIDESDIELLQNCGAHVIHCPESNAKLASGFCPVALLQQKGINVALGTDGAASNNDL
ncbi:MAG TPA: amidohydrolase family protein, partial [Cellvibrionaceae bacterium]